LISKTDKRFRAAFEALPEPVKYKGRDRFLIPASLTHGFLLEMVE